MKTETERKVRIYVGLTLLAAAIALGISAIASGQTYTEADFRQVGFRQIQNVHTGQLSRPLCGEDGRGIYFNSSDLQAGSCLLVDPFHPEVRLTVIGNVVWFPMNELAGFYETQCFSAWANVCGRPADGSLDRQCTKAVRWQAFRAEDLSIFLGQSPTLGGAITPVVPTGFTCPIGATRTPTPTPQPGVPTSTPVPPTAIPPTSTPNPSCPGEIRQLSDGGCYCVATGTRIACPGPAPKPSVTRTFAPPILLTATPLPDTPTPTPAMTPTWTPAPSSTAPPPPTATPSSGSGGGCRSKAATVPIVVPAIAIGMATWRRRLMRRYPRKR